MPDHDAVRVIPTTRLTEELPPAEVTKALAVLLTELALAQALVIIHGPARGARRYIEAGGHVRFDGDEVVLLWPTGGLNG
jgi:hypothetical protein